ncbi:Crp/Fnr family transcriptional regulator [Alkalibacter saccharofermentans]|uniref:CRP/FNR family transcriptional regulator, anaerobic regulatory protein n=1 Tax=Alkalibacter saccharofermentans DSM 14828 TaxID=1120975 RepID=A0A1M4WMY4_9FIRM|nr:Crp/Fnr family transcriptional regulator [Alkalibacter saccharofermentans]SHE82530.1 CRP/FNR family transcriptional regulator, anaerobic regulatory protein [Alkalibacter saccharofermentans DSM 14828]
MEHTCSNCGHSLCAKRVPIFSKLNEDEIKKVVTLIRRKHYQKGENLFFEGGDFKGLVIINKGKAKAYTNTSEGKEQILHLFFPGDFLGEKSLVINKKTEYNVQAIEPVDTCMISKKDFQDLIKKHPNINQKIMEELVYRIDRLESMIENIGAKDIEKRINAVLLEFAHKHGTKNEDGSFELMLPLSREGIASYIGTTRETVSRKLNSLQNEGVIVMTGNKKIKILDINRLK